MMFYFPLICFSALIASGSQQLIVCPRNEVFVDNRDPCNTCAVALGKDACILPCDLPPGCDCIQGYYRNDDGVCVTKQECAGVQDYDDYDDDCDDDCPINEEYLECGTCEGTCKNGGKPEVCSADCKRGCFCLKGLVRNDDGVCIPLQACYKRNILEEIVCPENESFYDCRRCDPTCDNPKPVCPFDCREGCSCNDGYSRNDVGRCIPTDQCKTSLLGNVLQGTSRRRCPPNESYSNCGNCDTFCDSSNPVCTTKCTEGCFCNEGYSRNHGGTCIPTGQCRFSQSESDIQEVSCPPNSSYDDCGSACPPTCKDVSPQVCTDECVSGCFCNKGFYKNDKGNCVTLLDCVKGSLPPMCPRNEIYKDCGSACPATCQDPNPVCSDQCVKGCFCIDGLVRNNGQCVLPLECPRPQKGGLASRPRCPKYESYNSCGSACPATCEDQTPSCAEVCTRGCFCNPGRVRNGKGKCVTPNTCPRAFESTLQAQRCPPNESFDECGSACPPTCKNLGNPQICTKQCVRGCFCNNGLYRNDQGKCVRLIDCVRLPPPPPPPPTCGINQEYYECMPDCRNRCNPPEVCSAICRKGCFCQRGLVLREDGQCVRPQFCRRPPVNTVQESPLQAQQAPLPPPPPPTCGINQEYYNCMPDCINRCNPPEVCPASCRSGCFCQRGLVLREDGQCVRKEFCGRPPLPVFCPPNENYQNCGTACQPTCNNQSPVCSQPCVRGCFCNNGLVRNNQGKCISPAQCLPRCGPNEVYSNCVIPCNSCAERGLCNFFVCNKGCDCAKGFYRNNNGLCIPAFQCPVQPSCRVNEFYTECGTACPEYCSDNGRPPVCTRECVKGCFCRNGYVRDKSKGGECVPRQQCGNSSPENCEQPFEEYSTCGSKCKESCFPPQVCPTVCETGCFCKAGYARTNTGICVPRNICVSQKE